jgi:voltage-gated potassium channel
MPSFRQKVHEVVFEAETRSGKAFDLFLLAAILLSVIAVCLESVQTVAAEHGRLLRVVEWVFTALFSLEYIARLYCVTSPARYATSFFGIIDLVAILPAYLSLTFGTSMSLATIRVLRLVRVFRVMKLARFLGEASVLRAALKASVPKIVVFLLSVSCVVVIVGSGMYVIEGAEHGFTSIPRSMYWAIVTVTTVGYGDIAPSTPTGQILASGLMLCGYAVLAVPTGIVSAELVRRPRSVSTEACPNCSAEGHEPDSSFCRFCGTKL